MTNQRTRISTLAIRTIPGLVATVSLGLVLAYWTWAWFGPRAVPRAQPATTAVDQGAASSLLFGHAAGTATAPSPTGVAITLLGVVAVGDGSGSYALLKPGNGKPQVARAGSEIAPGIRLEKIFADRVILERAGVRETLAWPVRRSSAAKPAQGSQP
ncbi:MAG TPA: type II secretion system protein N [Rhodanobacter sp.]